MPLRATVKEKSEFERTLLGLYYNRIHRWTSRIASDLGIEKLLDIPKCFSGTGEKHAAAIIKHIDDWDLTDQVIALCF